MRRKQRNALLADTAAPLLLGGAAFLAFNIGWRRFRRAQLFVPEREPTISWHPEDYGIPSDRVEILTFETNDGELLYGWYCRAERPVASALYCHGNTGNLTNSAHVIPHLLEAGLNILTFDYRGFGQSTGAPSFAGIIGDGLAAARLHERIRPQNLPSILYGYSLGGAIATQLIEQYPFDGLILQSTFTNLQDIARVTFPRLPLHLLSGKFFETLDVVRRLTLPMLTIHGAADEVCPVWMAGRIHEASGSPSKKLFLVEGGLHKDLFLRSDVPALVEEINRFASGVPSRPHLLPQTESVIDAVRDRTLRSFRRYRRRNHVPQLL